MKFEKMKWGFMKFVILIVMGISSMANAQVLSRNDYTKKYAVGLEQHLNKKFKPHKDEVRGLENGFVTYTSSYEDFGNYWCKFIYYVDVQGITRDIKIEGNSCFNEHLK